MKQFRGTALLIFLLSQVAGAISQDFRAVYPGTGSVTMSGEWRFHTSDDPEWADPSLDDRGWETITTDGTWGSQTHPGHVGFAWYRRAVHIDGVTGPLSIAMPGVNDAYELYWNGVKFAGQGKLPPNATWRPVSVTEVFPLPNPDPTGALKGELAIRVWKAPLDSLSSIDVGGLEGPPRIGDSKVLNEQRRLGMALRQQRTLPNILECAFMFVIGISSLAIWARDRRNRLFLWLALFLLSASGYIAFAFPAFLQWQTLATYQTYIQTISVVADISIWMLVMTVFGLDQERRWRLTTYWLVAVDLVAQLVDTATLFFWEHAGPGLQWLDGATTAVYSILPMYLFVLLVAGLRRRRDVALLPIALACVGLEVFSLINGALGQGKRFTHIDFQALLQKAVLHLGPDYILGVRGQVSAIMLVVTVWTVFRQQAIERKQQLLLAAK